MKTNKEIFLGGYGLVRNPDTWCQGSMAKDKENNINDHIAVRQMWMIAGQSLGFMNAAGEIV